MEPIPRTAKEYLTADRKPRRPYHEWLTRRLDGNTRAQVTLRVRRISETGNYGDWGPVGDGVFELRFMGKGPGHRVYFGIDDKLIVLLMGGDKSTQQSDIKRAKAYWKDYNA